MKICVAATGNKTSAIRSHRSRPRSPVATASAGTATTGRRFGRISNPIALHTPASSADVREPVSDARSAAVQNVAAGTSLIGAAAWNNTTGVLAITTAPTAPATDPAARRDSRNVN